MADAARTVRLTAEDLPYLAPDDGVCELVAGDLVREPPPGEGHGWIAGKLLVHVGRFVLERNLGRIYAAETGFVLARDPDTVRCPDAAFVSADRLAATPSPGPYFEGAPDLTIEVLSPRNAGPETAAKVRDYLAAGGQAVWVIDPVTETVTVHSAGAGPRHFARGDVLDGAPILPGFRLPVVSIFEP